MVQVRPQSSRLIDAIAGEQLVRRVPDPNDGRATYAVITGKGVDAFRATAPLYLAKIEEHFTRHLTDAEQRAIATGLGKVIAAHDRLPSLQH